MRYRPHDLSTQLCYLVDSKKVTLGDIAKHSGCSVEYIEKLTNRPGTKIDWPTRHVVGKAIAHFHRMFPETRPPSEYDMEQRRLKLVADVDGEEWNGTKRGVFEESDPPAGMRVFRSFTSTGRFCERREYMAADMTKQVERRIVLGMELFLDTVDPIIESMGT